MSATVQTFDRRRYVPGTVHLPTVQPRFDVVAQAVVGEPEITILVKPDPVFGSCVCSDKVFQIFKLTFKRAALIL